MNSSILSRMFTGAKIVPTIESTTNNSKKFQTGDDVRINNEDDDMNGRVGTFVYETNNIDGDLVYVIFLDDNKHYSTYPRFLEKK